MSVSALEPRIINLVEDGVFGNVSYLCLESDDTEKGAQFSSDLTFLNLLLEGPNGKEVLPLVVKVPMIDVDVRDFRNFDAMFHNEVVMYKEILPYLRIDSNFYPKLFYAFATNGVEPKKDLLILENLKFKNFVPSKTKIFLDIDHVLVVIKKIAGFHSFSFINKHEEKEKFLKISTKLQAIDSPSQCLDEFEVVNAACIERGFQPLIKGNVNVDLLKECLSLLKYPNETRYFVSSPEEPFAVICHGDFCNNNILYLYDENDKPVDCVFIDFQYSTYGSPAVDISLLLYLNTNQELREKYWDMILKLYWDELRKCVPQHIALPSFEDFLIHFEGRVIYGYTIAAFFLPEMLKINSGLKPEKEPVTFEEYRTMMTSIGGKEAEQKLHDIVIHLLNKGYIDAYIELCKSKRFMC